LSVSQPHKHAHGRAAEMSEGGDLGDAGELLQKAKELQSDPQNKRPYGGKRKPADGHPGQPKGKAQARVGKLQCFESAVRRNWDRRTWSAFTHPVRAPVRRAP
jgi:hypothetical protein